MQNSPDMRKAATNEANTDVQWHRCKNRCRLNGTNWGRDDLIITITLSRFIPLLTDLNTSGLLINSGSLTFWIDVDATSSWPLRGIVEQTHIRAISTAESAEFSAYHHSCDTGVRLPSEKLRFSQWIFTLFKNAPSWATGQQPALHQSDHRYFPDEQGDFQPYFDSNSVTTRFFIRVDECAAVWAGL